MRKQLETLARGLVSIPVKEYFCFKIYRFDTHKAVEPEPREGLLPRPLTPADFAAAADPQIRALAAYNGDEAWGFGVETNGEIVSALWMLAGKTYKRLRRDFWPMDDNEAELAALITLDSARGRGIAPFLINYSVWRMRELGFQTIYARIWHSNGASLAAFRKAGWQPCATVIEVDFRGFPRPLRIVRP